MAFLVIFRLTSTAIRPIVLRLQARSTAWTQPCGFMKTYSANIRGNALVMCLLTSLLERWNTLGTFPLAVLLSLLVLAFTKPCTTTNFRITGLATLLPVLQPRICGSTKAGQPTAKQYGRNLSVVLPMAEIIGTMLITRCLQRLTVTTAIILLLLSLLTTPIRQLFTTRVPL